MGRRLQTNWCTRKGDGVQKISDQKYLTSDQYARPVKLEARMHLHERYSQNGQGWLNWLFEQIRLSPGERVLEVGCGTGAFWRAHRERLPEGLQVTLVDISSGMLVEAASGLRGDSRFSFCVADVQNLPFFAAQSDVVIANHMLYHVPDIVRGVRELRRVLRPGGRLATATNGTNNMAQLYDLIASARPGRQPIRRGNARYALENAAELLGESFEQVQVVEYPDSLWITEVEPLVDYIESMIGLADGMENVDMRVLVKNIAVQIEAHGGFYIQKSVGLAVAVG
jgi:ubiquinone/menaquinone biosynthesis C-methylase UbiE